MLKIPANRVVAFVGPYLAVAAGGAAAWLVAKLNVLGLPGLGSHQHELATGLAGAGLWLLTSALGWLGHSKWLTGHHIELQNEGAAAAAALAGSATLSPPMALGTPIEGVAGVLEHEDFAAALKAEGLPDDETEFASPPPEDRSGDVRPDAEVETEQ